MPTTLFSPYTHQQVAKMFAAIEECLWLGLKRPAGGSLTDGGAIAFDSLIQPLAATALDSVAQGSRVYVANIGGTNWQAGVAEYRNSEVTVRLNIKKTFTQNHRQFDSPEQFVDEVLKLLVAATDSIQDKPNILAISFGFQHQPVWTSYGLDCEMLTDEPAKYWRISGISNKKLGQIVLERAARFGLSLDQLYFANDTIATALALVGGQSGFVAGTGTNGALSHPDYHHGNLVNLEAGRLVVLPDDAVLEYLASDDLLPSQEHLLEYMTGGDFLIKQLAVLIHHSRDFEDPSLFKFFLALSSKHLNRLSIGNFSQVEESLGYSFTSKQREFLETNSETILIRAAQVMAALLAAVVKVTNSTRVPTEGAVLWQGQAVKTQVEVWVDKLVGRPITLVPVTGVQGVATFALANNKKKAHAT